MCVALRATEYLWRKFGTGVQCAFFGGGGGGVHNFRVCVRLFSKTPTRFNLVCVYEILCCRFAGIGRF